ncbi:C1 family peptidase [Paraburkholderia sp.]|uniref:C1 family peptidase n=1 Tax=Paraburkholderia sp. TaxID=1926495 RepID=UPI0039E2BAF4
MAKGGKEKRSGKRTESLHESLAGPWYSPGSNYPLLAKKRRAPTLVGVAEDPGDSNDSDDSQEGPYYHDGDGVPLLAHHEQAVRPSKGGIPDSNGMPLFPVTSHHTHVRTIKGFGWTRDVPDQRDHYYSAPLYLELPDRYSLRESCPPVYDQKNLGSCSANAIAAAVQFERMRQSLPHSGRVPSRLFIYYNQRSIEGAVSEDCGAQIRDGIKCVAALGSCFEGGRIGEWAYDKKKFARRPPKACYEQASLDRSVGYSRLRQQLEQLKGCIASGWPFVFGFTCYESFSSEEIARCGVLRLPRRSEHIIGGHAVMAVGYDDISATFEVRNSWGDNWGHGGYFTMPYSYVTDPDLCADFWTIRLVSAAG